MIYGLQLIFLEMIKVLFPVCLYAKLTFSLFLIKVPFNAHQHASLKGETRPLTQCRALDENKTSYTSFTYAKLLYNLNSQSDTVETVEWIELILMSLYVN